MSDLVVIMHRAGIAQLGTPRALYETPANAFVADFIGNSNLLPVHVIETVHKSCTVRAEGGAIIRTMAMPSVALGDRVLLLVRPEDMRVRAKGSLGADDEEGIAGTISEFTFCATYSG